jgi:hypothetical protein
VLRRIFGQKRDEVREGWGKLHNEELHNLYSSPSIIRMIKSRRMKLARHVVRTVVKPEGKIPVGRRRCRWKDIIKTNFSEIWWGGMDWIDLAQDRDKWRALANTVMNLLVP